MMAIGKASIICLLLAVGAGVYFTRLNQKLEGVTVQISNGKLKGNRATSRGGRIFHEFLGIPYAEPPIGELRFEAPRPYTRSLPSADTDTEIGVYDATYYRSPCAQLGLMTALRLGAEDCLYLNIFTPSLKPARPLPVLVHFYGGLFMEGQSNMYGGKYFMDEDVVMVTLNYRVGALGFLNTGDGVVRGNMGLKDQTLALKWVRDNIATFGGDPGRVTIFGQSAGSAAVHYHMLSPLSKGLFHRAISQSGVALNPWAFQPQPGPQAKRFAEKLNCSSGAQMVACLKSKDVNEIISVHREVLDATRDPITVFVPSAELEDPTAFLTKNPFDIVRGKDVQYPSDVPWMSGLVQDEGLIATSLLYRNHTLFHMDDIAWSRLAPRTLYFTTQAPTPQIQAKVTQKIRAKYLPTSDDSTPRDERLLSNLTALFSDRHFHKGIHDAVVHYASNAKAPVYLYYYAHPTQFSLTDVLLAVRGRMGGWIPPIVEIGLSLVYLFLARALFGVEPQRFGVCHADEVHLFFNIGPHDAIGIGHVDYEASRTMVKTWAQFATLVDGKEFAFAATKWPKVDSKAVKYMKIGPAPGETASRVTGKLVDPPNLERLEFWNSLGLPNG